MSPTIKMLVTLRHRSLEAVSPVRLEKGTPVLQTRAFAPLAFSEPSYFLYIYRLKNESNCVPEQVVTPYLLQCCLEKDTSGFILKDVGTQVYHQSTSWKHLIFLLFQISVLQLVKDEQQWPWDPGGHCPTT